MRKYRVYYILSTKSSAESEIIECDRITAYHGMVSFEVEDCCAEYGYRTIAIRQNCNVTEVT